MRRAARVDAGIHAIIRDGLRDAGYPVFDVHAMPGRLDLDVLSKSGLTVTLEVKHAGENLTPAEKRYIAEGWPAEVVHSLAESLLYLQKVDTIRIPKPTFELCADGFRYFYQWAICLEAKDKAQADNMRALYIDHRVSCMRCQ